MLHGLERSKIVQIQMKKIIKIDTNSELIQMLELSERDL